MLQAVGLLFLSSPRMLVSLCICYRLIHNFDPIFFNNLYFQLVLWGHEHIVLVSGTKYWLIIRALWFLMKFAFRQVFEYCSIDLHFIIIFCIKLGLKERCKKDLGKAKTFILYKLLQHIKLKKNLMFVSNSSLDSHRHWVWVFLIWQSQHKRCGYQH